MMRTKQPGCTVAVSGSDEVSHRTAPSSTKKVMPLFERLARMKPSSVPIVPAGGYDGPVRVMTAHRLTVPQSIVHVNVSAVGVLVTVAVAVGVRVGVAVAVDDSSGVAVMVAVAVLVLVIVAVDVAVRVAVCVAVDITMTVFVGNGVAVGVAVRVAVRVADAVVVADAVRVAVGVSVRVGVSVTVPVRVTVGVCVAVPVLDGVWVIVGVRVTVKVGGPTGMAGLKISRPMKRERPNGNAAVALAQQMTAMMTHHFTAWLLVYRQEGTLLRQRLRCRPLSQHSSRECRGRRSG